MVQPRAHFGCSRRRLSELHEYASVGIADVHHSGVVAAQSVCGFGQRQVGADCTGDGTDVDASWYHTRDGNRGLPCG